MTLSDEMPMTEIDEAMEKKPSVSVFTDSAQVLDVDSPEERRLVRKLDGRIMPIACILYLFACKYGN